MGSAGGALKTMITIADVDPVNPPPPIRPLDTERRVPDRRRRERRRPPTTSAEEITDDGGEQSDSSPLIDDYA